MLKGQALPTGSFARTSSHTSGVPQAHVIDGGQLKRSYWIEIIHYSSMHTKIPGYLFEITCTVSNFVSYQ